MSLERSKPIDFGSFSDTAYFGNPSSVKDRQFSQEGVPAGGGNIADENPGPNAKEYMVPDFMGASGQGANRPYDARKEGN